MRNKSGFTLIELSIVLVIIGLIIGGVLMGRDLIEVASRQTVISDLEKTKAAINTFRVKYNCLPGDCPNATTFFGAADADPATCIDSTNPGTCNGNGDGRIGGLSVTPDQNYEDFRMWQQLSLAGLVAGQYTGIYLSGGGWNYPGTLYPKSRWRPDLGMQFFYLPAVAEWNNRGSYFYDTIPADHYTRLWGLNPGFGCQFSPLTTGDETRWFDMKVDDGMPNSGDVQTMISGHNCLSSSNLCNLTNQNTATATYPATPTNNCPVLFRMRF